MAIKSNKFLSDLAIKAGVNVESQEFKTFIALPALETLEIEDSIAEGINRGLMNEAAALSNRTILNKARAEAYNNSDKSIEDNFFPLLDDEEKAELAAQKLTIEKIATLAGKIKGKLEAKAKADPGDKAPLQREIEKLNADMKALREGFTKKEGELNGAIEGTEIKYAVRELLADYPYLLATNKDQRPFAIDTAWNKVQQDLQAAGYKIVRENGKVKVQFSDGREAFDANNNPVVLQKFIEGSIQPLLATNKKEGNDDQRPPDNAGGANAGAPSGAKVDDALKAIADMDKALQG